jgi:L-alanine-DL-glutamate epimerase-like enolase superfamily enzyme
VKLEVEPIQIETAHPFRIARGTRTSYEIFVVSLTHDGVTGRGEAAPQPFYGESPMTVRAAINSIGQMLDGRCGSSSARRRRTRRPRPSRSASTSPA